MVLTILGRAWFALTLSRIALALLRGQVAGFLNQWVPVQLALQVLAVTLVLVLPILAGTFCLVVPGAYLAARWSQVVMLLLDGRAQWFEALEHSSSLTAGFRFQIVLILIATTLVAVLGDRLFNNITLLEWAWRAVSVTFAAALSASLYYHLSLRAPWNPEVAEMNAKTA